MTAFLIYLIPSLVLVAVLTMRNTAKDARDVDEQERSA
jgi:hypothetical protein